jgi:hypothetical protein
MARLKIRMAAPHFVQFGLPPFPPDVTFIGLRDEPDENGNLILEIDDPNFSGCYAGLDCKMSYNVSSYWGDEKGQQITHVDYNFNPHGPKLSRQVDNFFVHPTPEGKIFGGCNKAMGLTSKSIVWVKQTVYEMECVGGLK